MWISERSESEQQILRILALQGKLKASEISRLTGFHRQTVYKGLSKLLRDGIIKQSEAGIRQYSLSDSVEPDHVLDFFESEKEYRILTIHGDIVDSVHVPGSFRGTFFDFGFIPLETSYGCRISLESIPTSAVSLFRNFADLLRSLHYRLEEIYWTINNYSGGSEFGVGIESFIKTISKERQKKKAVINISFVIQDWFGGYYGFLYNIQARWTNLALNKGVIDQVMLHIVLEKIPIGKKFAISWSERGLLPYVEPYTIREERLLDARIRFNEENMLGFVDRFGFELIFPISPVKELPQKILARTRFASMAVEDLIKGNPYRLKIARIIINPSYTEGPAMYESPTIELICAIILDEI
jgi:DNA-binding Lrp family transcriptional regulator